MKVTDLRRKLAASLVAGGLLVPTAHAADLDTNLVVNGGFENVDINSSEGGFNAVEILNWTAGTATGFAYSHDGSLNGAGGTIPDYANGGIYTGGAAPAGTGSFYFTSNATSGDITDPGQVSQIIDVSSGATGSLISQGEAAVGISGFFTGFGGNADFGTIQVDFLDSGGGELASASVADPDPTNWTFETGSGFVPVGTESLQVSVFGAAINGGPDGYIDNVDVQITSVENLLAILEVNTATGEATLRNNTGESIFIDYYEIFSDGGLGNSLQAGDSDWNSFEDQNLAGFPAGDGSGNGWEESGGSGEGVLAENYLTGNSELADGAAISLGELFDTAGAQDLAFNYSVVTGGAAPTADYNGDGTVNAADYTVWRNTLGSTTDLRANGDDTGDSAGVIDAADYEAWRNGYGETGGPSGPGALTTGFVRYVGAGAGQAGVVPEPTTLAIVSIAATGLIGLRRRRD